MTQLDRLLLVAGFLLAGCGRHPSPVRAGSLSIEPGYANAAPTGNGGTAYFVVRNGGSEPDTIRSITVAGASSAQLHTMARPGSMERMTPLDPAVVPPHGSLALKPGEAHLMFEGLGRQIRLGDTVVVRLEFGHNGPAEVPLVVRPYGG